MGTKLKKIPYDNLIFVEDGTVYSMTSMREIASDPRKDGHRYVSLPSYGTYKLEYVMAALFLNNGIFPKRFDLWTVKFKDNDPTNCAVSNITLIKTPMPRSGRPKGSKIVYCLIDLLNNDWEELGVDEIAARLKINKSTVQKYAKHTEPKRIYNSRYIIGDIADTWDYLA